MIRARTGIGNPYVITSFPTPDSVIGYQKVTPDPQRLLADQVAEDYIVRTQRPNYQAEAGWRNEAERPGYIQANKLRFLRPYQLKSIRSLQAAVGEGKDRFLFEMATGTGKTLTAAAVIKLFLRSGNAQPEGTTRGDRRNRLGCGRLAGTLALQLGTRRRQVCIWSFLKLKMAGDVDAPVVLGGFSKSGLDAYLGQLVRASRSVAIAVRTRRRGEALRKS